MGNEQNGSVRHLFIDGVEYREMVSTSIPDADLGYIDGGTPFLPPSATWSGTLKIKAPRTRKRYVKLRMACGLSRNAAEREATVIARNGGCYAWAFWAIAYDAITGAIRGPNEDDNTAL